MQSIELAALTLRKHIETVRHRLAKRIPVDAADVLYNLQNRDVAGGIAAAQFVACALPRLVVGQQPHTLRKLGIGRRMRILRRASGLAAVAALDALRSYPVPFSSD